MQKITLRYVYVLKRATNMAACNVGGYRHILESVECPVGWKEKTLQAGWLLCLDCVMCYVQMIFPHFVSCSRSGVEPLR